MIHFFSFFLKLASSRGAPLEYDAKFRFAIHLQGIRQFHDNCKIAKCKQSHTSRKYDVFIVLESETTLPLIIVVIIHNRRKITPKKNLDQFPFLLFTDIYSSSIRTVVAKRIRTSLLNPLKT